MAHCQAQRHTRNAAPHNCASSTSDLHEHPAPDPAAAPTRNSSFGGRGRAQAGVCRDAPGVAMEGPGSLPVTRREE